MADVSILVTDGEQRSTLAAVRSLGRAGFRPYVCSSSPRSLAGASRWTVAEAQVADPLRDPDRFAADVERLARSWGVELVIPMSESAALAVFPARARLEPARIPFPAAESFRRVSTKSEVLERAAALGIATPEQRVVRRPGDAPADLDSLAFPVVVKPSRSVVEARGRRTKLRVEYATDRTQLESRLRAFPAAAYPMLLQQRIVGPGIGIFLLVWEGRLLAVFSHRRIREKPPSGGVSVYRESIAADPALVERSRALLEGFGWQGVAMLEYKMDAATGTPYLMEVNGRFWGSLQLAIDAGVDFPALLVSAALGRATTPVLRYRTGVRSRWWWGDVDHLLARFQTSRDAVSLPPDAPGRLRALLDFLVLWRPGDRGEILRFSDPWPFVRESLDWLRRT